jgi:hypothetical protein
VNVQAWAVGAGVGGWRGNWEIAIDCHRLPSNILCASCLATGITQEWNMARIRFQRKRQMWGPDFRHIWESSKWRDMTYRQIYVQARRSLLCWRVCTGICVWCVFLGVYPMISQSHDYIILYLISLVSLLTGKQFWNSSGLILWLTGRRRKWRRACPGNGVVPWIGI